MLDDFALSPQVSTVIIDEFVFPPQIAITISDEFVHPPQFTNTIIDDFASITNSSQMLETLGYHHNRRRFRLTNAFKMSEALWSTLIAKWEKGHDWLSEKACSGRLVSKKASVLPLIHVWIYKYIYIYILIYLFIYENEI